MSPKNSQENPNPNLWIIWSALLFSQFAYIGVLFFQHNSYTLEDFLNAPQADFFIIGLGVVTIITLVAIEFLAKKIQSLRASGIKETTDKVFTLYIVIWALCDSISIYGLVIGLSKDKAYIAYAFIFFAIGIVSQILKRPKLNL